MAARKIRLWSYAEVVMPGPSRPDGVAARVSSAPSSWASAFIFSSAASVAAERAGERPRRVVAGPHDQRVQQLVDRVGAAGADADLGALLVRVLLRALDLGVRAQLLDHHDGQQALDQRRGPLAGVRVLGGQHVAAVEVGDRPRGGADATGRGGCVRRAGRCRSHPSGVPRPGPPGSAAGRGSGSPGWRLFRRVDGRRRQLAGLAGARAVPGSAAGPCGSSAARPTRSAAATRAAMTRAHSDTTKAGTNLAVA